MDEEKEWGIGGERLEDGIRGEVDGCIVRDISGQERNHRIVEVVSKVLHDPTLCRRVARDVHDRGSADKKK